MTYSSARPSRSLWNTIFEPFGDHAGDASTAGWLVRLVRRPSMRLTTCTSLPSVNAILVASGDQLGAVAIKSKVVQFIHSAAIYGTLPVDVTFREQKYPSGESQLYWQKVEAMCTAGSAASERLGTD